MAIRWPEQTDHPRPSRLVRRPRARFDLGSNGLVTVQIGHDGLMVELDVAAKLNVRPATNNVGGDGHRAKLACIGDNLGLLLVLAGIQNVMRDALLLKHLA